MSGPRYQSAWDEPEDAALPDVVAEVRESKQPVAEPGALVPVVAPAEHSNTTAITLPQPNPTALFLAKTFRAERRRRQWSQRTMTAALGLALGTYRRIEAGHGCTIAILDRACHILDWIIVIRGAPK